LAANIVTVYYTGAGKGGKGGSPDTQRLKLNVTCVCVGPDVDVAVHALVIADVPPAGGKPWFVPQFV